MSDGQWAYSAEQWAAIERELPAKADAIIFRAHLEALLGAHQIVGRAAPLPTLDNDISAHEKLAATARALMAAYRPDMVIPERGYANFKRAMSKAQKERGRLIEHLNVLAARAERTTANLKGRKASGRRGRKREVMRDYWLGMMANFWIWAGGELKTSVTNGEASGPAVRYMVAAAAPAYRLTPAAARAFLRNHANRHGEN